MINRSTAATVALLHYCTVPRPSFVTRLERHEALRLQVLLDDAQAALQKHDAEHESLVRERDSLQQQLAAAGDRAASAADQAAAAARRTEQLENALKLADSHLQKARALLWQL